MPRGVVALGSGLLLMLGCGDGAEVPESTSTEETQRLIQNPFGGPEGDTPPGQDEFMKTQPPK